jgi:ABC-type transport system substrate-binding protein
MEQLLTEVGFAKDAEGFFASEAAGRLRPDFQVLAGTQFERGGAIMTDTWRRAGIDVQPSVLPAVQVRQNEVRNTFPGISTPGGTGTGDRGGLEFFTGVQIGTPGNGWTGSNRGGWANGEYDRLFEAWNVTLDQPERARAAAGMMKLLSEEVPGWPLYWDFNVQATLAGVHGPALGIFGISTPFWNAHEWEMR